MSYFIQPAEDQVDSALDAWNWLDLTGKQPILVTAFADVFFGAADGIWFLDTLEGKLRRVFATTDDLRAALSSPEGQDHYLLGGFVDRAIEEGMTLGEGECYDFALHPVVGGAIDYSNIEKSDFLVALHIRGQLHEQARHLPDGVKITKFLTEE